MVISQNIAWFRSAAPYIQAHRGCTFVVYMAAGATDQALDGVVHDAALLATLGIRLVVVFAAADSFEAGSDTSQTPVATDFQGLREVLETTGRLGFIIESKLSAALANVPLAAAPIRIISGNYVRARPLGIHSGEDFGHTGEVRRIDAEGIHRALDSGQLVLIPPIGHSPSGDLFRLDGRSTAARVAVALKAQKLIILDHLPAPTNDDGAQLRELTVTQARSQFTRWRQSGQPPRPAQAHLEALAEACGQGVRRGHLLDARHDGALLCELLTRDGIGTLVAADVYDETRPATADDMPGIVELIAPLERSGALVHRPRDRLEGEVDRFVVMERDGTIVACAAAYPLGPDPEFVELACLAVHPSYRNSDRGDALLRWAEQHALGMGASRLFVLTTQAVHWFTERGFEAGSPQSLPAERRQTYDAGRNSRVLIKVLD